MLQWLEDVLTSVPEDFKVDEQELPTDAVVIDTLPPELVPLVRAWMYTHQQIKETKRSGVRRSATVLADLMSDQTVDRKAVSTELEALVKVVEQLERQEKALRALLNAVLWQQFASPDDESIGIAWNLNEWVVFRAPDDRPTVTLAGLLAVMP